VAAETGPKLVELIQDSARRSSNAVRSPRLHTHDAREIGADVTAGLTWFRLRETTLFKPGRELPRCTDAEALTDLPATGRVRL